ncbi:MAG: hypothetical protein MK052_01280, partial [Alphaproteobacteria bacterium]|nr:hypothetical protein [Alphaproteobacteria bacterium]
MKQRGDTTESASGLSPKDKQENPTQNTDNAARNIPDLSYAERSNDAFGSGNGYAGVAYAMRAFELSELKKESNPTTSF